MLVGGTHQVARPGRSRRRSKAAGTVPSHTVQLATAPLPAVPRVGNPSVAPGPWPVDAARAHADARRVLASIDWSKRDIVIWVPGTGSHRVHEKFADAVHGSWSDGRVSLTHLEYEASSEGPRSVATGIATLKLVLMEIAARGGNRRVLVGGESQGAWILGEAMADPSVRKVVDRAVLLGHPSLAKTHWHGRDPAVLEYSNPGDPAAGDPELLPGLLLTTLGSLPGIKGYVKQPHDYSDRMSGAVEFLRTGTEGYRTAGAPGHAAVAATYANGAARAGITAAPAPAPGRRGRRPANHQPVASQAA